MRKVTKKQIEEIIHRFDKSVYCKSEDITSIAISLCEEDDDLDDVEMSIFDYISNYLKKYEFIETRHVWRFKETKTGLNKLTNQQRG